MDKEREPKFIQTDDGYSEKALDLAVDKDLTNDQTKGGNIFVNPKKKKKPQE